MRKPIIAGNWKMYKTSDEAEELVRALIPKVEGLAAEIVVCPPFTALERVAPLLRGTNIALGAQNVHWEKEGAFTGEVSPAMLRSIGVEYALVGHSERRMYFHEDDQMVNRRALGALEAGLKAIVCVGERLEERESDSTNGIITTQLHGALLNIDAKMLRSCVIAYEPVWAIGTGKVATPEQAQEVHRLIRQLLRELYDQTIADEVRIQYGGSVKGDNAAGLLSQPDIDGALVGGASLKADGFAEIVRAAG